MTHRLIMGAWVACAAFVPAKASADETPTFGRAGTVVLDDVVGGRVLAPGPAPGFAGVGFQAGWLSFGSIDAGGTSTRYVRFSPSIDWFVSDGASIGMQVGGGISRYEQLGSDMKGWDATIVPRFGYAFDLAEDVAVWPRIGAGVTLFDSPMQTKTGTILRAALEAPFVFRLSRRVVFDIGPELAYVNHLSGPIDARGITGGARGGISLAF